MMEGTRGRLSARAALTVFVSSALLTGCGSEPSVEGKGTKAESGPACVDMWVSGEVLPADYEGCIQDDDSRNTSGVDCQAGEGSHAFLYSYDGLFAFPDQVIEVGGEEDQNFIDTALACMINGAVGSPGGPVLGGPPAE